MSAYQSSQKAASIPDADSCRQSLGDILRSSRLEQGLSLRALAKRVGLSAHSGVAEYERGTRIPPADLIEAYERALALPAGYLKTLRQQVLRERARSGNADSNDLSVVPSESDEISSNYRLAISVVAAVTAAVSTAVIVAKVRRFSASGPSSVPFASLTSAVLGGRSRNIPLLVHVHIYPGIAGKSDT